MQICAMGQSDPASKRSGGAWLKVDSPWSPFDLSIRPSGLPAGIAARSSRRPHRAPCSWARSILWEENNKKSHVERVDRSRHARWIKCVEEDQMPTAPGSWRTRLTRELPVTLDTWVNATSRVFGDDGGVSPRRYGRRVSDRATRALRPCVHTAAATERCSRDARRGNRVRPTRRAADSAPPIPCEAFPHGESDEIDRLGRDSSSIQSRRAQRPRTRLSNGRSPRRGGAYPGEPAPLADGRKSASRRETRACVAEVRDGAAAPETTCESVTDRTASSSAARNPATRVDQRPRCCRSRRFELVGRRGLSTKT